MPRPAARSFAGRASLLLAVAALTAMSGITAPAAEPERLVLLVDGGPLLVDLHLSLDGRPYREARETLVDEALALSDTDGDGTPTWGEAILEPRLPYQLRNPATNVRQLDADGDGVMTRDEARALVERNGGGPALLIVMNRSLPPAPRLEDLVDVDGDGTLSDDELTGAMQRLRQWDRDDDDMLDVAEILGTSLANVPSQPGNDTSPGERAVIVRNEADVAALRDALLMRYGEEGRLRRDAWPLVPALFDDLDANGNGLLDGDEPAAMRTAASHLTLVVNVGRPEAGPVGVQVTAIAPPVPPEGVELGERRSALWLRMPTTKLVVRATADRGLPNSASLAKLIVQRADADRNGYLEKTEAVDDRGFQNLSQQFEAFDANADGKVYADEIEAFYTRMQAPLATQVLLVVTQSRPTLFNAVDVDGDGRLSLRELRGLRDRFATIDANGDRRTSSDELPGEMTVTIGRTGGRPVQAGANVAYQRAERLGSRSVANRSAPRWFTAMDRNGDGDLTPREFLGTYEQFSVIDADGDRLIDASEAAAGGAAQ